MRLLGDLFSNFNIVKSIVANSIYFIYYLYIKLIKSKNIILPELFSCVTQSPSLFEK